MRATYLTVTGNLTRDPVTRHTKDDHQITEFGLAHNYRKLDRTTGQWEDTEPTYYTVTCWRRLAENVDKCLEKGDPVVVHGKFTTREYETTNGQIRVQLKIEAESVGPDLQRTLAEPQRKSGNSVAPTPPADAAAPVPNTVPDAEDPDDDREDHGPAADVEAVLVDALPAGSQ
ncbi:single-stranded DNA-binding protein [Pseudonocardia endophytica]|uniref:Single-stranded DNA-binding protein n=1 Tax=Pseudonocardia endophytica TaxID=401976 RepID=A0A4R1HZG0_PSEEN|nr:single-stranded DNA-binding protein [Pseudonocardia endophytica]TCK25529.1 single-strand DNA-binding protein [Pseudonocardia endophytica]